MLFILCVFIKFQSGPVEFFPGITEQKFYYPNNHCVSASLRVAIQMQK